MAIIYFDTETTSLIPGQICQLAYLLEDSDKICSKNFYFMVDEMDAKASEINGFTVSRLKVLSEGCGMGDHIEEISQDFERAALIIAHNFNFDFCFMRTEFDRLKRIFRYREKLCSMRTFKEKLRLPNAYGGYKNPSLDELARSYGVSDEEIKGLMFEKFDDMANAHDARYDTCKLYLALNKARRAHPDIDRYISSRLY